MTIGDDYAGSDFYCDVAIPHAPEFTVVHDDDHVLAFHHTVGSSRGGDRAERSTRG